MLILCLLTVIGQEVRCNICYRLSLHNRRHAKEKMKISIIVKISYLRSKTILNINLTLIDNTIE